MFASQLGPVVVVVVIDVVIASSFARPKARNYVNRGVG
jgi:hypothetical protein